MNGKFKSSEHWRDLPFTMLFLLFYSTAIFHVFIKKFHFTFASFSLSQTARTLPAILGNREGVAESHVVAEACDGTARCANVSDTVNTICHICRNIPEKINFTASQDRARSTPNESRFPVGSKKEESERTVLVGVDNNAKTSERVKRSGKFNFPSRTTAAAHTTQQRCSNDTTIV